MTLPYPAPEFGLIGPCKLDVGTTMLVISCPWTTFCCFEPLQHYHLTILQNKLGP